MEILCRSFMNVPGEENPYRATVGAFEVKSGYLEYRRSGQG